MRGRRARPSRRQRHELDRFTRELSADAGLRYWGAEFARVHPDPPRDVDRRPRRTAGDLVPMAFLGLLLTGTALTVLSASLRSPTAGTVGLILFLLAPVCALAGDRRARHRAPDVHRPHRSGGGMWLLP